MIEHAQPEAILNELVSQAKTQQKKSLTILHAVLKQLFEQRAMNYSIANVARLSVAAGGPSASSIRNKTGFRFRLLIEAWAAKAGTTRKTPVNGKGRGTKIPKDYDLLRLIPDPAVRACFSQIIAERNRFLMELNLLKSQKKLIIDLRPSQSKSTSTAVQVLPALSDVLNEIEIAALRAAIAPGFFDDKGWRVTASGQVKDQSGQIYKHGYTIAIKKILTESA